MDISEVLRSLKVKSVYWVDDEHAKIEDLDVDHLLSSIHAMAESKDEQTIRGLKRHVENVLGEDRKTTCRRWFKNGEWARADSFDQYVYDCEDPQAFLVGLFNFFEGDIENDALIDNVERLMTQAEVFERYSFNRWNEDGGSILESLEQDEKILLLVDLHNAKEQCLGLTDGYQVIEQVTKHEKGSNVYVLVLTSKFDKEQEIKQGRKITNEYCANRALPVFVISKSRDLNDGFPQQFSQVLDRVLLATSYTDLKHEIEKIYGNSIAGTFEELRSITIEELIYKVARLSSAEGVPEIESVLRIIDGTVRFNLQQALASDDKVVSLLSSCRRLDAKIERSIDVDDSFIQNFTCRERYENHKAVNNMHLPIQVGDVFSLKDCISSNTESAGDDDVEAEQDFYILLGNFCFTSLRDSGKRKDTTALLFPLRADEPNHEAKMTIRDFGALNPDMGAKGDYYIDFSSPRTIDYFYLDMCWTNSAGKAEFQFDKQSYEDLLANAPLIRSQRRRLETMLEEYQKRQVDRSVLRLEIDRIGRLSEQYALKALHHYSRFLSDLPDSLELV
ncbi:MULTISPECIES: hypothetical protein [Spongiibacter]|uniref:hypothetical protein n=1 Tax=Spongiibacter TaxID=630749 RepID=UPI000C5DC218|nr:MULTISPECIES: hypothetical protein [Spongiibacter]MAY38169.1 hypothetical protein [Spongiibacter sp.]MBI59520.1 hypothetical protein [Spongiibacter sp.]MBU73867.1 hypothetical protein [Spongiibacter sp.]|tara:strand:+ start:657 stop:2339 length:1683 start_codon:yes stop_codon:yes gene_type:complete